MSRKSSHQLLSPAFHGAALAIAGIGLIGNGMVSSAQAASVTVRVTNLAPDQGVYLTPVFVTFHDGSIDLVDVGGVSSAFQRLAEDGSTQPLADRVAAESSTAVTAALPGGLGGFPPPDVLGPGQSTETTVDVDPADNRYFSYATMVIPSNDAFIANVDGQSIPAFDAGGTLMPIDFVVNGSAVLDAGTEANTETDAAFLDQSVADAGTATTGEVDSHPGFHGSFANPDATPVNILGGTNAQGITFDPTAADFTLPGYELARIEVFATPDTGPISVPTPAASFAGLAMLAGLTLRRRRG